jgi:dihydroneopterin aldolase
VTEAERAQAQRLLLTIVMESDFAAAAVSDDLTRTIDYFEVSQRLLRFGEGRQWRLIETLADQVATMILAVYPAHSVSVEVKKFVIPEARYVSVRLSRKHGEPVRVLESDTR